VGVATGVRAGVGLAVEVLVAAGVALAVEVGVAPEVGLAVGVGVAPVVVLAVGVGAALVVALAVGVGVALALPAGVAAPGGGEARATAMPEVGLAPDGPAGRLIRYVTRASTWASLSTSSKSLPPSAPRAIPGL
jgi:hypothetical protein